MPTIKYCDWATGDDTTGDGSNTLPYKTITKASTGLTGGDEVRAAKSPAPTALTGTIAFTAGSTTITGTGTAFTTQLAIGDFVEGGDGYWYEVITIASNTSATLYQKYSGTTASGVSSRKLGVTDTGAAAASTTAVQTVSVSGSSTSSILTISGGWDLSTQTQTGMTYFRQMNGTFSNRYGYGLYLSSKSYIEVSKIGLLRYNYGVYTNAVSQTVFNDIFSGSNGYYGLYINNSDTITINNTKTICDYRDGIYVTQSGSININNPICNGVNFVAGIEISSSQNVTITNPIFKYNASGLRFATAFHNNIISPVFEGNSVGVYYSGTNYENILYNPSGSPSISSGTYKDSYYPWLKIQKYNEVSGDNRCYFATGITYRDTANARSGECLKYDPTSATYYISQSFFFKADASTAQTLSAYIKAEAAFNGDVQGAIYFLGEAITDWTDITPTADDTYEQKSLVAAAVDIIEDGVLELRIKVRGTAGNVYVDDLATA